MGGGGEAAQGKGDAPGGQPPTTGHSVDSGANWLNTQNLTLASLSHPPSRRPFTASDVKTDFFLKLVNVIRMLH